jgi:hypothetical protein
LHPVAIQFAQSFRDFLVPFADLINNYHAFDLEAAIDLFCRYNINNENRNPQEMETLKGVLRQITILDIEAKRTQQMKEKANQQMDDY